MPVEEKVFRKSQVIEPKPSSKGKLDALICVTNLQASVLTKDHILKSIVDHSLNIRPINRTSTILNKSQISAKKSMAVDNSFLESPGTGYLGIMNPFMVKQKKIRTCEPGEKYQGNIPPSGFTVLNQDLNNFYRKKVKKPKHFFGGMVSMTDIHTPRKSLGGNSLENTSDLFGRAKTIVSLKDMQNIVIGENLLTPLGPLPTNLTRRKPRGYRWEKTPGLELESSEDLIELQDKFADDNNLGMDPVEPIFGNTDCVTPLANENLLQEPEFDSPSNSRPQKKATKVFKIGVSNNGIINALNKKGSLKSVHNMHLQKNRIKRYSRDVYSFRPAFLSDKNYDSYWMGCIDRA